MFNPSLRKGTTEPTSYPADSIFIQDDQFLPDYSQEIPFQYINQDQQPQLQPPFHYLQDLSVISPPSSIPSSPTSSPASSISHFPVTTGVAADYSTAVFDGCSSFEAPSMTPASSYNPAINVQHSGSPQPQSYLPAQFNQQQFVFDNSQMLTQQYLPNNHTWEQNLPLSSPAHTHNNFQQQYNSHSSHLQTPNSSSGRSPGNSVQQRPIHHSAPTKPLPTPVHTPVQRSFLTPQYQKNDLSSHDGSQSGHFMTDQQPNQSQHQHHPSDYSLAPSVSTVSHNSPTTPHTSFEDADEIQKALPNGENQSFADDQWLHDYLRFDALPDYNSSTGLPLGIPKLNRTLTDVIQDELYTTPVMQGQHGAKLSAHQQNFLAPSYQNPLSDRLQAAHQGHLSARNRSPVGSIQRERSPFRQNSPLAAEFDHDAFQQQAAVTSVPNGPSGMGMQQAQAEPKTISPKDAVLNDFNEGEDHTIPFIHQSDFNLGDTLGLRQDNTFQPAPGFPSVDSFTQFGPAPGTSQPFGFNQPRQSRRQSQQQNSLLHQTPDFPASLPRFESTGSEVFSSGMTSPSHAKTAAPAQREISRPQDTSADSGTYTCTYHGCTQRFETPGKLQKHKREAHRQTTPGGHLVARDGSPRNSQAGPHKCDRINPSTGKPCGSVFSRPYDLTRHEDTIHNARKQKVRCHLCTEEKTFSRNDALTRHMRVVHPEVDWPGKQRRKGRE
ncbi:stress-regulated transcription factor RPN4 [Aspergillus lucknowensis]|uniref:C2H2 transcription factor n=1 Tax=Aspergillus lucknowensis TaxID=176173 RepID=A0ABR4LXS4_9EURO